MSDWLILRLFGQLLARKVAETRISTVIAYTVLIIVLVIVGSFFYLLGTISTSLLPLFLILAFLIGIWNGLYYIGSFRPKSWWFIPKISWFWFEGSRGLGLIVLLAAATALPYYVGQAIIAELSPWLFIQLIVSVKLLLLASALLGSAVALATRRVSSNGIVRLVILIIAAATTLTVLAANSNFFQLIEWPLSHADANTSLILLLASTGALATTLVINDLLLQITPIVSQPRARFWHSPFPVRLLRHVKTPKMAYFLLSLTYYVRGSHIQRRLIVLLLAVFLLPFMAVWLGLADISVFFLEYAIVFLLVLSVSLPAGQRLADEERFYRNFPQTDPLKTAHFIAGGVALSTLVLLMNQLFSWRSSFGLTALLLITTWLLHLILSRFGTMSAKWRQLNWTEPHSNERIILSGVAIAFLIALLPLGLLDVMSATEVNLILLACLLLLALAWKKRKAYQ